MSIQARDSMKTLTYKVIQADLAYRKNNMLTNKGKFCGGIIIMAPVLYMFHQVYASTGPIQSIEQQAGDVHIRISTFFGNTKLCFRAYFRPEIYYQDKFARIDMHAQKIKEIVEKNPNIKFNSYVWH